METCYTKIIWINDLKLMNVEDIGKAVPLYLSDHDSHEN